jgi:hypothetical protein
MAEKKSYLEQLQDLREGGNEVAQKKIDDYFGFGKKKHRTERKKQKRKRFLDEEDY